MSAVVTFKVPLKIKEKMRKLRDKVNWSSELRSYVIKRIREIEAEEILRNAVETIDNTDGVPKGFSVKSVREDHDSN